MIMLFFVNNIEKIGYICCSIVPLKEILLSLDTSLGSKIETEISEICPDE